MQSGLKVVFQRADCASVHGGEDKNARLVSVKTLAGETLLDVENGVSVPAKRVLQVATLDFLSSGGSGYVEFIGVPVSRDLGILRERMAEYFLKVPALFTATIDGRWLRK